MAQEEVTNSKQGDMVVVAGLIDFNRLGCV